VEVTFVLICTAHDELIDVSGGLAHMEVAA
jgi:hypothetical protein